jgi:hypothetical protein
MEPADPAVWEETACDVWELLAVDARLINCWSRRAWEAPPLKLVVCMGVSKFDRRRGGSAVRRPSPLQEVSWKCGAQAAAGECIGTDKIRIGKRFFRYKRLQRRTAVRTGWRPGAPRCSG